MATVDSRRRRGSCTAFEGTRRLAQGALADVAAAAKAAFDRTPPAGPILVFDDATGEQIDLDFSGSPADVQATLAARERHRERQEDAGRDEPARGPGRPRLGVVAREVTLLPRHWQWLNGQPGGASVALRRLVDEARRANVGRDRVRRAQEVAYRVMSALAGNLPGFEEATRALFAGNAERFEVETGRWPDAVRDYARTLATGAFDAEATS